MLDNSHHAGAGPADFDDTCSIRTNHDIRRWREVELNIADEDNCFDSSCHRGGAGSSSSTQYGGSSSSTSAGGGRGGGGTRGGGGAGGAAAHHGERVVDKSKPQERSGASGVIAGKYLWVYGGYSFGSRLDDLWRFDLEKRKWQKVHPRGDKKPMARENNGALVVRGKMYQAAFFRCT